MDAKHRVYIMIGVGAGILWLLPDISVIEFFIYYFFAYMFSVFLYGMFISKMSDEEKELIDDMLERGYSLREIVNELNRIRNIPNDDNFLSELDEFIDEDEVKTINITISDCPDEAIGYFKGLPIKEWFITSDGFKYVFSGTNDMKNPRSIPEDSISVYPGLIYTKEK